MDSNWCAPIVRAKLESVEAPLQASRDPTWSVGSTNYTVTYLKNVQGFVHGPIYDRCIKFLVKPSTQPNCFQQLGITGLLVDSKNEVTERGQESS